MLREKQSLRRWREAQSPAHPSGGSSPWLGGCGTAGAADPPGARGSHGPLRGWGQRDWEFRRETKAPGAAGSQRGRCHLPWVALKRSGG